MPWALGSGPLVAQMLHMPCGVHKGVGQPTSSFLRVCQVDRKLYQKQGSTAHGLKHWRIDSVCKLLCYAGRATRGCAQLHSFASSVKRTAC